MINFSFGLTFGGIFVLASAIVLGCYKTNWIDDRWFEYEAFCQRACTEMFVDSYRTDLWDWKFWRHHICSFWTIQNCNNPFSIYFKYDERKYVLLRENSELIYEVYNFTFSKPNFEKVTGSLKAHKERHDFFLFNLNITLTISPQIRVFTSLELRRPRFHYQNLLDLDNNHGYYPSRSSIFLNVHPESNMTKEELQNICILIVGLANYQSSGDTNCTNFTMNVGKRILTPKVLLSEGGAYVSFLSTVVNIWLFAVLFYFVWHFLQALHGHADEFSLSNNDRRVTCVRPDLILLNSEDLNIFTSYFYNGIYKFSFGCRMTLLFICFTVDCLLMIRCRMNTSVCLEYEFVIYFSFILSSFLCLQMQLFIFFCRTFLSIMPGIFKLERIFYMEFLNARLQLDLYYMEHLYHTLILCLVYSFSAYVFINPCRHLNNMSNGRIAHQLLWPTWPVQLLNKCVLTVTDNVLCEFVLKTIVCIVLCYLSFLFPDYCSPNNADFQTMNLFGCILFGPVYLICTSLCHHYNKVFTVSLLMESAFMTISIQMMSSGLLSIVYPVLKLFEDKTSMLFVLLFLTLVNYIRSIYKDWYTCYNKYLNAVVKYVKDKHKCELHEEHSDKNIEINNVNIHLHTCNLNNVRTHQNGNTLNGRNGGGFLRFKGLATLNKGSKVYIPSDFFFEVIQLNGGPGPIKWTIANELSSLLLLKLFPAMFIYWLCHIMFLANFEKYDSMLSAILGAAFVNQYKELFMQRKQASTVDVENDVAFQKDIDKLLENYESVFLIVGKK